MVEDTAWGFRETVKVYKEISKEIFNIRFSTHWRDTEGKAKECSNYDTIALISHTSKEMLKILQVRLQQQMWTMKF